MGHGCSLLSISAASLEMTVFHHEAMMGMSMLLVVRHSADAVLKEVDMLLLHLSTFEAGLLGSS